MFYICRINKDVEENDFILYDNKSFKPEDFNVYPVKEISIEELKNEYNLLPILSLTDFVLRTITKKRTNTSRLADCYIETFKAFEYERDMILQKKSKLSKSQRELVLSRYDEIVNCTTEDVSNIEDVSENASSN
jgi:hypothetical protein